MNRFLSNSPSLRRHWLRLIGVGVVLLLILVGGAAAWQAEAEGLARELASAPVEQRPEIQAECSLLDDEQVRGLMSGMFETKLLIACGRADEL
ncbi:MAG: hypothetical protein L0331_25600, partial [Chloroflexi bacterium]|nr:hypothetical protein [Chloroflexota bacterium]MCI0646795.1 hypothetical protein [Chloroflexota bacterium]